MSQITPFLDLSALRYSIILSKQGILVRKLHTRKLRRIYALAAQEEWDHADLIVRYGETGLTNGGEYLTSDELKLAISAFTEPELLAYLRGEYSW